jgi:DHA1 family multidrug resistance protein-like MFS transporter
MVGTFGFIIFQIPVAMATSLPTIFICRFIAAAFGSAPLAIIAGVYVDIWDAAMRGIATMGYTAAVFAGPVCGPIIGEYTVKNTNLSWRWTIWSTTIMASFFFVLALPTVPETRASMILRRKAARLSYLLNKFGLKPIKMIVKEPILIVMTVYISFVYGILYLIFFAYPISFHSDRQWASGVSSLPFLAVFVGVLSSCAYMAWETKVIYTPKLIAAQKVIPEQRLPPMMIGSVILVVGLFWFAWTSSPSINPWPQIISGVFIGGGVSCHDLPLSRVSTHTDILF